MDQFKEDVAQLGDDDQGKACEICFNFLRTYLRENHSGVARLLACEMLDTVENRMMDY